VPKPRQEAPTAAQVISMRRAAHELGHPMAALAYAFQFECSLRQYDVIGQWVPIGDPRPSAILSGGRKWLGPMWSQIDDNMILSITPSKTENSTGARALHDLKTAPMVLEELAKIAPEARCGPLIISPRLRLPYRHEVFRRVWVRCTELAGLSRATWNRDLRAGGVTEARQANASMDDVARTATHASKRTTATVYDRDTLEAARRVAQARTAYRGKE
jgi:hypothetical protein